MLMGIGDGWGVGFGSGGLDGRGSGFERREQVPRSPVEVLRLTDPKLRATRGRRGRGQHGCRRERVRRSETERVREHREAGPRVGRQITDDLDHYVVGPGVEVSGGLS